MHSFGRWSGHEASPLQNFGGGVIRTQSSMTVAENRRSENENKENYQVRMPVRIYEDRKHGTKAFLYCTSLYGGSTGMVQQF